MKLETWELRQYCPGRSIMRLVELHFFGSPSGMTCANLPLALRDRIWLKRSCLEYSKEWLYFLGGCFSWRGGGYAQLLRHYVP